MTDRQRRSYTERDARDTRQVLLDMVPNLTDKWTDFHESDLGVVFIELLSYISDQQSYHIDRMALESFFTQAMERKNVFSGVRALGYSMHGYYSSETTVQLRSSHSHDIYINRYDLFSTEEEEDGEVFYFSVKEDVTIPPNPNVLTEVPLIQGTREEFTFEYEDVDDNNTLILPNAQIAENFIRLIVDGEEWTEVQDALFNEELEEVFSVEYSRDGFPMIRLMHDWESLLQAPEDVVFEVIGLESVGSDGNIGSGTVIKIVSELEDSVGNTDCTNTISDIIHRDTISGGVDPETIEEARVSAPKRIRTLWSVVTLRDYEDYIESHPQIDRCLALDWSVPGTSVDDPYRVEIILVPSESETSSQAVKDQLYQELMERRVTPTKLELKDPSYVTVDFDITVYVEPDYDQPDYLRVRIRDVLQTYFSPENRDFGETIRPAAIRYHLESTIEDILLVDFNEPESNKTLNMAEFPSLGDIDISIVKEEF